MFKLSSFKQITSKNLHPDAILPIFKDYQNEKDFEGFAQLIENCPGQLEKSFIDSQPHFIKHIHKQNNYYTPIKENDYWIIADQDLVPIDERSHMIKHYNKNIKGKISVNFFLYYQECKYICNIINDYSRRFEMVINWGWQRWLIRWVHPDEIKGAYCDHILDDEIEKNYDEFNQRMLHSLTEKGELFHRRIAFFHKTGMISNNSTITKDSNIADDNIFF